MAHLSFQNPPTLTDVPHPGLMVEVCLFPALAKKLHLNLPTGVSLPA